MISGLYQTLSDTKHHLKNCSHLCRFYFSQTFPVCHSFFTLFFVDQTIHYHRKTNIDNKNGDEKIVTKRDAFFKAYKIQDP